QSADGAEMRDREGEAPAEPRPRRRLGRSLTLPSYIRGMQSPRRGGRKPPRRGDGKTRVVDHLRSSDSFSAALRYYSSRSFMLGSCSNWVPLASRTARSCTSRAFLTSPESNSALA